MRTMSDFVLTVSWILEEIKLVLDQTKEAQVSQTENQRGCVKRAHLYALLSRVCLKGSSMVATIKSQKARCKLTGTC